MNRSDIEELYYITHIDNLKSILHYGILCHNKAKRIKFKSVADEEVQKRREKVVIPGGKSKLHDYANLYFNARNSMMFKRKDMHKELVVLRIDSAIFDEPDVIISDRNASSYYVRFYSPEELDRLNGTLIFADDWRNENYFEYRKRRSIVCAEVLVPDSLAPKFITGIYVSRKDTYQKVVRLLNGLPLADKILINPNLFFQKGTSSDIFRWLRKKRFR